MKRLWICMLVVLLCLSIVTGCKKKNESDKTDSFHQNEQDSSEKDDSSADSNIEWEDDSSADSNIEWKDDWGTDDETTSTTDKNTSNNNTIDNKDTADKNTSDKNTTVEDNSEEDTDVVETPEKEEIIWTKPVIQP